MNTHNQTDYELIKQFINNDPTALEELISRHKDRVYTYIFMYMKNEQLAEDIFQDTFVKVIRSLRKGKYKDEGRFVSWVMRIAHNLIIDHFRKAKHYPTYNNDDYELDIFNSTVFSEDNIEDSMVHDQITQDVRNLIEELPDDQKEVVLMRHYMGLSFKEISEQTDVSINTALGRMRYALINLRKLIEEKHLSLTMN